MTIFRWIIGVFTVLVAAGAILSFLIFLLADVPLWIERARHFRPWTWLAMLLWFNVDVWGRVIYTLVHWVT